MSASNYVILIGRSTRNIETKTSGETTVARFSLAVDRRSKDKATDFISCVAFNKTAEILSKYVKQGTKIAVSGEIRTGNYTNKDGVKVYTTDVLVNEFEFCESKKEQESAPDQFIPEDIPVDSLPFK